MPNDVVGSYEIQLIFVFPLLFLDFHLSGNPPAEVVQEQFRIDLLLYEIPFLRMQCIQIQIVLYSP